MTVQPCGTTEVTAQDLMGMGFKFCTTSTDLARIVKLEDKYLVPKGFFWVPMEGFYEISNSPVDFVAKTASGEKITISHTGYGQFAISGVSKYASALGWDATNLTAEKAKFILATQGLGKEASTIIKSATSKQVMVNVRRPTDFVEKKASTSLKKFAYSLKSNLIKAASYVENTQSIDSLLSLNFINPDNIAKFVGRIHSLKATISDLAMLLMASRLGIKEIPEQAVSSAMTRLIEVVNGLEALRAVQEQPQQQA
jgi:hypothetical protein